MQPCHAGSVCLQQSFQLQRKCVQSTPRVKGKEGGGSSVLAGSAPWGVDDSSEEGRRHLCIQHVMGHRWLLTQMQAAFSSKVFHQKGTGSRSSPWLDSLVLWKGFGGAYFIVLGSTEVSVPT